MTAFSAEVVKSTINDQKNIEITIYNNGLGLVKEARTVELGMGEGEIRFMDVASMIMPETVHIKSTGEGKGFTVLEQNYEYDLISNDKLLDKYVGKDIKLVEFNEYQGQERGYRSKAFKQ